MKDSGEITGITPHCINDIKKNFVNVLNNPERFSPTLFLSPEEITIDDKKVLWVYVPSASQVVMFNGKIYDRNEDGDIDITRNSELVTQLHSRKSHEYSERKIFPYADESDLDLARLMPKVRNLVKSRFDDHPWLAMSDMEIMKSAGLYQEDFMTGKSGFNLAAILLFGKDDIIRSCTANYVTDAICRKENIDRYDDRLIVRTNLIEAYEQLSEFIAKHTSDKFFMLEDQSVSIRSKIVREIVSNSLVHREYTSAFPAKIIIERDKIITENWNLPKFSGTINPTSFTPYPKNPILANFFVNIGRADALGSGVRNLYKYTKMYSGGEPELYEDDVFKTVIPLKNIKASDKMSDKMSDKILAYLRETKEINTTVAAEIIDRSPATARRLLRQMVENNILVSMGGNKNRTYRKK